VFEVTASLYTPNVIRAFFLVFARILEVLNILQPGLGMNKAKVLWKLERIIGLHGSSVRFA
jgi:hypothetical protein